MCSGVAYCILYLHLRHHKGATTRYGSWPRLRVSAIELDFVMLFSRVGGVNFSGIFCYSFQQSKSRTTCASSTLQFLAYMHIYIGVCACLLHHQRYRFLTIHLTSHILEIKLSVAGSIKHLFIIPMCCYITYN